MILRFTGKQVNTSYSSEQMLVMLFLCNSLDSHPTIIFKPNGSFCRPTTLHGVYFQNHYCLQWMVAVLASDAGSL
jgi:hypothetical protein